MRTRLLWATLLSGVLLGLAAGVALPVNAQTDDQRVLGPGLYVFQTRTRDALCGDDEKTGFVSTFVATIDGVPGARQMKMKLLNSEYWPVWDLTVHSDDRLTGFAGLKGDPKATADSKFEMTLDKKGRFTGTGARSYNATIEGKRRRCQVSYDVLIKPLSL